MEPQTTGIAQTSPRREPERSAVLEQLERMLADPLFKHSKRYPNLLRYVVERTLEGGASELKERTLGVAVFGREPTYDTSIGQRRFVGAFPESPSATSPDVERVCKRLLEEPNSPVSLFQLYYMGSQNIALQDVVTFGKISSVLAAKSKTYHLRGENLTTF